MLRRVRYGALLARHGLLFWAAGRRPTEMAAGLCCARASLSRLVRAYRAGTWVVLRHAEGQLVPPWRRSGVAVALPQALVTRRATLPQPSGGCRTRWRCATRALTRHAQHGVTISAEPVRRWLHTLGWGWKRAQLLATDHHPCRAERVARRRGVWEPRHPWAALVLAEELDLPRWPKGGAMGRPKGPQGTVMTPGQHAKPSLAGAREVPTGTRWHCRGARQTHGWCRDSARPPCGALSRPPGSAPV